MFNLFNTRKGRLQLKLTAILKEESPKTINSIMDIFDEYERDNVNTIEKLKRERKVELNKINGALRQTINAHGPINKELLSSASKRIFGAMLINSKAKKTLTIEQIIRLIMAIIILGLTAIVFFF